MRTRLRRRTIELLLRLRLLKMRITIRTLTGLIVLPRPRAVEAVLSCDLPRAGDLALRIEGKRPLPLALGLRRKCVRCYALRTPRLKSRCMPTRLLRGPCEQVCNNNKTRQFSVSQRRRSRNYSTGFRRWSGNKKSERLSSAR